MGIIYLHGRCIDGAPVMYIDLNRLLEMLKNKLICELSFASLHNFFAGYINRNMLVPGQVEKWLIILNNNHFPVKKLPVKMFKAAAKELSTNWMQNTKRTVVVNLTSMQQTMARFLQKFLDPTVVARQVFSQSQDPE